MPRLELAHMRCPGIEDRGSGIGGPISRDEPAIHGM